MRLLTVVSVVLGSVPLIAAPAAAATAPCERPVSFTAQADASILKLALLDLKPLGLNLPQVVNLTLAPSKANLATDAAVRSSASAEYLDAAVLGLNLPRGPLEARVAQQAPPSHQTPAHNTALGVHLGLAKVGTGDLTAQAEWADGMACGTQVGRAGSATSALVDAAVLPSASGALVRASQNLHSQAATATVVRDGRAAAAAAASAGLSKLELLGEGAARVTIRVIEPPLLTVVATGRKQTSAVDYKSPIIEISGPGIPTQRLSGLGRTIELPIPATGLGTVLGGLPLGELGLLPQALPAGLGQQASLLRLTIGDLEKTITDREVTASAASIRLQILTTGSGRAQNALVDLSVALLRASATAPALADAGPSTPPQDGCGTPGCKLPLTGLNIGLAAGTGILLFVLGRFLLVLAGRRSGRRAT